jgi:hypothetical protein
MSKLHQLHAEKIVPTSWLRKHTETIILLPLIAGVIAGIISLVGALNRLPGGEDHAAPPVSADHQPQRGHG